jgi:hypothetical protein
MTSLFPPSESLVSDTPAGDGKMTNLFLQCSVKTTRKIIRTVFYYVQVFCFKIIFLHIPFDLNDLYTVKPRLKKNNIVTLI